MSKIHVGCTIGPIFNMLNKARRPKEIWLASYLFSRFAERMVERLVEGKASMISPSCAGCKVARDVKEVGLYSDRLFFSIYGDEKKAQKLVECAKAAAIELLAEDMACAGCGKQGVIEEYLRTALYVLYVMEPAASDDSPIPMHELTAKLDEQECYPPFVMRVDEDNPDYLTDYLENASASGWMPEAMAQVDFQKLACNAVTDKRKVKNYLAMVQADGDSMGKLLQALSVKKDEESVKELSAFLFERGKYNAQTVGEYGALPIYFGGDDMLFLAPIYSEKGRSVFELVSALSNAFDEAYHLLEEKIPAIRALAEAGSKPALSFGISICYTKYPLRFIRESAAGALFSGAKKAVWTAKREKKAVAIEQHKHSGQICKVMLADSRLSCETPSTYQRFIEFVANGTLDSISLHALHWKAAEQKEVIAFLLMELPAEERTKRLTNWLKANFNEGTPPSDADLKRITDLFVSIADDVMVAPPKAAGDEEVRAHYRRIRETVSETIDGIFRINELLHAKGE